MQYLAFATEFTLNKENYPNLQHSFDPLHRSFRIQEWDLWLFYMAVLPAFVCIDTLVLNVLHSKTLPLPPDPNRFVLFVLIVLYSKAFPSSPSTCHSPIRKQRFYTPQRMKMKCWVEQCYGFMLQFKERLVSNICELLFSKLSPVKFQILRLLEKFNTFLPLLTQV